MTDKNDAFLSASPGGGTDKWATQIKLAKNARAQAAELLKQHPRPKQQAALMRRRRRAS